MASVNPGHHLLPSGSNGLIEFIRKGLTDIQQTITQHISFYAKSLWSGFVYCTDLTGRAHAFNVHLLADPSEKQGVSPILVSFTPTEHQEEEL